MTSTRPFKLLITLALVALAGCASRTQTRATEAATTPLNDLNIVKAEIPEVLQAARRQPYLLPADRSCQGLVAEIRQLDEVLGADLDTPPSANSPSLLDRGSDLIENHAIGAIKRTAEGLVPFRSWVRKLSGAERYAKQVSASITAGSVRRAFLKGVASTQACEWLPPTPPAPAVASAAAAASAASAPAESAQASAAPDGPAPR